MNGYKIELTLAPETEVRKVIEYCRENNCDATLTKTQPESRILEVTSDDPVNFFSLGFGWFANLGVDFYLITAR